MAKKCKCPEGVPEWIVTYGDMMSLLLCFFILLAAFSELKKEEEFQDVLRAIQQAFGYQGGTGMVPNDEMPTTSIINRIEAVALQKHRFTKTASAEDPGVTGRTTTVKRIREGLIFTIGGRLTFEPGSAELKEEAQQELAKVAEVLRGKNNKIEIRGHTANLDLPPGSAYRDLWELSYARAAEVMRFLTRPEHGIRPQRIRVTGCANHEPLKSRVYEEREIAINRRVEIIASESLVQDFEGSPADPDAGPDEP